MDNKIKTAEEESKDCASKSDDNYFHDNCHNLWSGMPATYHYVHVVEFCCSKVVCSLIH